MKNIKFHIDSPIISSDGNTKLIAETNAVGIEGWLLADNGNCEIIARVASSGKEYLAITNIERNDVARVYPEILSAKNSGFFVSVPLGTDKDKIQLYCKAEEREIKIGEFEVNLKRKEYLPKLPDIVKGIRLGRNVYEGYQRGWGLQFDNSVGGKILNDPLFKEARLLAGSRTIVAEANLMNIFLIMKYNLKNIDSGHIIEFGSYKGGSAIFMAQIAKRLYPGIRVYALDTFTGMPDVDKEIDAHDESHFNDVDLDELKKYTQKIGLDNLEFHQGLFEDTAEPLLKKIEKVSLAHIDCDIYSAVAFSYEVVKNFMVPGGYVVFDDACVASCIGATEAVETLLIQRDGLHSEQIYPHFVFRIGLK